MVDELVDMVGSLVQLMDEETVRLQQPGRLLDHQELTAAKLQLVGSIERRVAQLSRSGPEWLARLGSEDRPRLLEALAALRTASDANARVLTRQIDLSTELMAMVAAEAQRLTGKRNASYCELGILTAVDVAAPISVNASL